MAAEMKKLMRCSFNSVSFAAKIGITFSIAH
jgi:hypothetical protein